MAVPTRISDIIDVIGPNYNPKTGWSDFGATTDETEYERDMDSEGYYIEQSTTSILEKITEVNRTLSLPVAEITPENMQILEEGTAITTLAAAASKGAEKVTDAGSIEQLTRYRIAMIAMRDKGFGGIVTETGQGTRGPFVAFIGYQAALAAEGSGISIKKGELASRDVKFTFFPEATITDPLKQIGRFAFETAPQTIPII